MSAGKQNQATFFSHDNFCLMADRVINDYPDKGKITTVMNIAK